MMAEDEPLTNWNPLPDSVRISFIIAKSDVWGPEGILFLLLVSFRTTDFDEERTHVSVSCESVTPAMLSENFRFRQALSKLILRGLVIQMSFVCVCKVVDCGCFELNCAAGRARKRREYYDRK